MKKLIIFGLLLFFTIVFAACGNLTTGSDTTTQGSTSSSTSTESTIDTDPTTNFTTTAPITTTEFLDTTTQTTGGNSGMEYKGTYDRLYPDYYVPGEALIEDPHIVYINWDGFARYYYDELLRRTIDENAPILSQIMSEGVFFENFRNTMPSITNPVQNQILSGATSAVTKNVYRYYDKNQNKVIQQQRENASDLIVDIALQAGLSVVSVHHYLAEPFLTSSNPSRLYVFADNTNPDVVARGSDKFGDHFSRSEQLEKVLSGVALKTQGITVTVNELPNLILLYCDDLDAIGHNFQANYGYAQQYSEEGRMDNVITLLRDMDAKLGEIIETAKAAGVYDQLTFFLTTDHGMTPYGASSLSDPGDYAGSKYGELKNFIESFNSNFKLEFVKPGDSPSRDTNVVVVGANLNVQLTFLDGITDEEIANLKAALLEQYYVGKVMTRLELEESGYWMEAADMVISPAERYVFSSNMLAQYFAKGQHDSLADTANHIVGWIWGKGIKKNYIYDEVAYNYDFGVTMAAALGLVLPEANGIVLDVFEITEEE